MEEGLHSGSGAITTSTASDLALLVRDEYPFPGLDFFYCLHLMHVGGYPPSSTVVWGLGLKLLV
jgi:hypothetical protein